MGAVRALHRRVRGDGDGQHGTSMIEVVVAMIIMTICGGVFTGAVISLYHSSNQVQAVTDSAQQTNQAYQSLDKLVRYASVITTPGRSTGAGTTGDWYVELRDTSSGSEICTQLRMDAATQELQRRTWATTGYTTAPAWLSVGSKMTNTAVAAGSADQPFVLQKPTSTPATPRPPGTSPTSNHQVLTFTLVARSGPASAPESNRSSFSLTALNSILPVDSTPVCTQAGRP